MQVHAQAMLAWFVQRLDTVDLLDAAARRALLALPLQSRLVGGRAALADGEDPSGAHLILSGIAYRYEIMPDGARRILALYFPGDLCFSHVPAPNGPQGILEVLGDGMVADLPARMIQSLIDAHPTVERALWWLTAIELGIVRRWLSLAGRLAEQRIAHLICEILARSEAVGLGRTERWPSRLRQGVIADVTAMSTVHVSRVLQGLKHAGLIALKNGTVVVQDQAGLASLADFDPGYLHLPGPKTENRRDGAALPGIPLVVPMGPAEAEDGSGLHPTIAGEPCRPGHAVIDPALEPSPARPSAPDARGF